MSRLRALLPVVLCLLLAGACTRDRVEGVDLAVEADPVDPAELVGPEPETEAPEAAYLTYVVKVGDALATVAAQHGTTVEVIRELNPQLTSDNLLPGDEIRIPAGLVPLESAGRAALLRGAAGGFGLRVGRAVRSLRWSKSRKPTPWWIWTRCRWACGS